eukprot:3200422-Amphidinium_carterae.1
MWRMLCFSEHLHSAAVFVPNLAIPVSHFENYNSGSEGKLDTGFGSETELARHVTCLVRKFTNYVAAPRSISYTILFGWMSRKRGMVYPEAPFRLGPHLR